MVDDGRESLQEADVAAALRLSCGHKLIRVQTNRLFDCVLMGQFGVFQQAPERSV